VEDVVPDTVNTWSLGYGWHWNWSGTTATLTSFVEEVFGSSMDTTILYKSSRYSLNVGITVVDKVTTVAGVTATVKNGAFTAAANMITDESDVYWYVQRGYAAIVEPDWQSGGMVKSTNRFNRVPYGSNAPIYSFYKRDELQVCRVAISYDPSGPQPTTTALSHPEFVNRSTLGGGGGSARTTRPYYSIVDTAFSCGGVTVSYTAGNNASLEDTYGERSMTGDAGLGGLLDPPWSSAYPVPTFYSIDRAPGEFVNVSSFPPARFDVPVAWSYSSTLKLFNEDKIGAVAAVVPIFDAEAIFLYGRQNITTTTDTTTYSSTGQGGYWGKNAGVMWVGWASPGIVTYYTQTSVNDVQNTDDTTEEAYLVYSGGATPARADLLKLALEDYGGDIAPLGATVFTSASSTPAVISGYINSPVNTDRTGELNAMVGWV